MLTTSGRAVFTAEPETGSVIAGSLCRLIVALCGAYGVCLLLNDSFRFTGRLDMLYVFVACAVCCLVAYGAAVTRFIDRGLHIVCLVFLAIILFFLINGVGAAVFFYYAPITAWNRAISTLAKVGFTSLSYYSVNVAGTDPNLPEAAGNIKVAYVTLCAIVSFIFVHSTVRKIRLIPPIITAAAAMTACFTYNLMNENFAFLFIVSSGVGLLTLKYCAAFTATKKANGAKDKDRAEYFKRASISGVAGLVAAALVFSVGVYPAKTFTKPIGKLSALESLVSAARSYLYGYISGEKFVDASYSSISTSSSPIKPTSRIFENARLFTLRTQSETPVYLRSWIGQDFSYGKWILADPADSYGDTDYMPEDTSEFFYTVLGIKENKLTDDFAFDKSNAGYGFLTSYISLVNLGFKTDMLYLPSRFSSFYGLLEQSIDPQFTPLETGYSVKHNGMINLYRVATPSYSAVAHLPYYLSHGFTRNMIKAINEYNFTLKSLKYLPFYTSPVKDVTEAEVEMIRKIAAREGITISSGNILNSVASMSKLALEDLCRMIEAASYETENAYRNYTAVPESERDFIYDDVYNALGELKKYYIKNSDFSAEDLSSFAPTRSQPDFDTLYRTVYRVVSYLADTAEYTLTPYGYTDGKSYIYQFLHTARNGYCTQYASAAVMMLRALGIPARYVEGFKTGEITEFGRSYRSVIRDNNAHSWIEVYVEGPGWMTFEATEPMLESMYADGPSDYEPYTPGTGTSAPPDTAEPDTGYVTGVPSYETSEIPTDTEPATTDEQGPAGDPEVRVPVGAIVAFAVLFAVMSAVFAYMRIRKKKYEKLTGDLKDAAEGRCRDPYADTVTYCDYIFRILSIIGYERGENELMNDFAERAGSAIGSKKLKKAMEAAQRTVFAKTADAQDCENAAKCALELREIARWRLRGLARFIIVNVRKIV